MYFLGIDIGTSSVKAIIIDREGNEISSKSESYDLLNPFDGWFEQNPEDWWMAVTRAIKALGQNINLKKIKSIAVVGQMHGLVILDKNNEVIRPAILWNDTRTNNEVEYLNTVIGKNNLIKETGNIAYAGFTAPKLLWLKNKEANSFERINKILLPKDYITYKLTGRFVTDYSDASGTLLLDVKNKIWSKSMLDLIGITENQLPLLFNSTDKISNVSDDIADIFGFSKECEVAAGAGDNAAAAVGMGISKEGECNISLGTSGTIFITSDNFIDIPESKLHSFVHADGKYHIMGVILSAASANRWWVEDILQLNFNNQKQLDLNKLGNNNTYFLPYLVGERSPHNDADIRGSFIGLSMETTQEDMSISVLEGVAFALRDCLEVAEAQGIKVKKATITGGGSKSRIWKEIIANVINSEIVDFAQESGPSYGAAIIAAVSSGVYKSISDANTKIEKKISETIYPNKQLVSKYNNKYKKFKTLYPMLESFYK